MQVGTARTIHALLYSGIVFSIGVFVYRSGKHGRGLALQGFGLAAILIFVLYALVQLTWIHGLVSILLLVLESVLIIRFWRL